MIEQKGAKDAKRRHLGDLRDLLLRILEQRGIRRNGASLGPAYLPRGWCRLVNQPQTEAELKALRRSVHRSQPYGSDDWLKRAAVTLGLESTLRPRGRPKKE